MVICCGRLVVVSSIPPGDFFFVFSAADIFAQGLSSGINSAAAAATAAA
jgi:hypothetical protein